MTECNQCGACCVSHNEKIQYRVALTDQSDIDRLPDRAKAWVFMSPEAGKALRTKTDEDGFRVCMGLEGKIGGSPVCSIYENRPKLCRNFATGSKNCHKYRRLAGLEASDVISG